MRTLYVMRHAKSSWKDPALSDHRRPLNKRGRRNVPVMAQRLNARNVRPDRIVCSDARRALDTAIPIAEMLGLGTSVVRRESGLYHATARKILDIVKHLSDRWPQVMIVGHNPGLQDLANRFLTQSISKLPTAGIVELTFDTDSWQAIDPQRLIHSHFDFPKNRP